MSTEELGTPLPGTEEATPDVGPETTASSDVPATHDEETTEASPTEEQPTETVLTEDGTELSVTAEERQRGYLREDDYTRKTMALSEKEKAVSTKAQKLDQAIEASEVLIRALAKDFYSEFDGINWDQLSDEHPDQWVTKKQKWIARQGQLQEAVNAHRQQVQQREQEKAEKELERKRASYAELMKAVPEWKDPEKFAAADRELTAFLTKSGYTPEEIGASFDHRFALMARDAMQYRKLNANKPKPAPVTTAPPPPAPAPTRGRAAPDLEHMPMSEFMKVRNQQETRRARR